MVIASAEYAGAVQPIARNIAQVAISVAMVIPLTGLAEVPISPQMRDDTVTKRNPKITTKNDATMFSNPDVRAPAIGLKVSISHIATMIASEPSTTHFMAMSRSSRPPASAPACCERMSFMPLRSALTIVGMVFISVIRPAMATAPAPIGRM